jgi:hypothetical protein
MLNAFRKDLQKTAFFTEVELFQCSIPSDHFYRLYAHFTSGLLRGVYLPNFSFIFLYKWTFLYLYVIN